MKNSLIILLCFAAGVLCSYWGIIPECDDSLSLYILYVMMFLVGIGLGSDLTALSAPIKKYKFQILLIPLSTIVGTIAACCLFSLFCPVPLRETVAIGCGFGYYSLSAILLNELAGADIGTIALICNLSRELLTLLTIPLLARYCGKLAPITAAGATSIDTTLPLISAPSEKNTSSSPSFTASSSIFRFPSSSGYYTYDCPRHTEPQGYLSKRPKRCKNQSNIPSMLSTGAVTDSSIYELPLQGSEYSSGISKSLSCE